MYSVKPGRGPSLLGAVAALVIGVPFVIFWISKAAEMKAPGFFVFFGSRSWSSWWSTLA